jgi:hypothetical protein
MADDDDVGWCLVFVYVCQEGGGGGGIAHGFHSDAKTACMLPPLTLDD